MNVMLFTRQKGCSGLVVLSKARLAALGVAVMVGLPAAFMSAGYYLGQSGVEKNPDEVAAAMQAELQQQRQQIVEARRTAEENVNALALRLGQLQAHVIRLDALGERLTKMAKLDKGEFDFNTSPAQGGPASADVAHTMNVPDFLTTLSELSAQLDSRSEQLEVLETMLMSRNLQAEVMPAGRPVKRGWLSSYFGKRTDPFTGRRVHHAGVDFAGKMGSDVVAVAAGVVTYSGKRYGYGKLVEIDHGTGYTTRYGHNSENLVKVGDTVKKGHLIAKMGSSGRSTGPHVHFEVLRNGRAVNPKKYVHAAR